MDNRLRIDLEAARAPDQSFETPVWLSGHDAEALAAAFDFNRRPRVEHLVQDPVGRTYADRASGALRKCDQRQRQRYAAVLTITVVDTQPSPPSPYMSGRFLPSRGGPFL